MKNRLNVSAPLWVILNDLVLGAIVRPPLHEAQGHSEKYLEVCF